MDLHNTEELEYDELLALVEETPPYDQEIKKSRTTKKHFKIFKEESLYWIKKFGLLNYEWVFSHEWVNDGLAMSTFSTEEYLAKVQFSTCFGYEKPDNFLIRQAAFHEICEVLIADFHMIPITYEKELKGKLTNDDLTGLGHMLIRRLENAFFIDSFNKRFGAKKTIIRDL